MQGETQDPKIIWSRGVIERQLKHMIRLVDDLLDVSRIARGKIVLVSERVNVAEIIAAAVETVQPLLEQKKQQLEVSNGDADLTVRGDPVRLSQVVGNLLHNAAKYTGEGGSIVLATALQRRHGRDQRSRQRHRHLRRIHAAHLRVVHADSE